MHKVKRPELFCRDKQAALSVLLTGFWQENNWPLREIAIQLPNSKYNMPVLKTKANLKPISINFACGLPNGAMLELKFAIKSIFESYEWTISYSAKFTTKRIFSFLAQDHKIKSLLDRGINEWVTRFRTYLTTKGIKAKCLQKKLNSYGKYISYELDIDTISRFRSIYKKIYDYYDERNEWDKDFINLKKAGVSVNETQSNCIMNMGLIKQPWLRDISRFAYKSLSGSISGASIVQYHETMKSFSAFLFLKRRDILNVGDINRPLILAFIHFLKQQNCNGIVTDRHVYRTSTWLNKILSECQIEEYPGLTTDTLITRHDLPKRPSFIGKNRDIPESVVKQMECILDKISIPWRFILILMLCTGSRISEILTLKCDCLSQDKDGTYWLTRTLHKQNDIHQVPIPMEVATMVKAIIEENEQKFGTRVTLVFPGRSTTKPLCQGSFSREINRRLRENNVKYCGDFWHFQSHQCRHYVGSKWLDKGIELHFVQRFLGHHSPENTLVYARIKEARLMEANKTFVENRSSNFLVDKSSNVLSGHPTASSILNKMLWVQTLPNGFCTRPLSAKLCDAHIECFACDDFATTRQFKPVFEVELIQGIDLVQSAKILGLETVEIRQTNKNTLLQKYIKLLANQDTVSATEAKF